MVNTILAFAFILASFLTAFAALLGFAFFHKNKSKGLQHHVKAEKDNISFLFEDDNLADLTTAARQIFATANVEGSDWGKLVSVLKPRFKEIDTIAIRALENGAVSMVSGDGTSRLEAEITNGMLRLELTDVETSEPRVDLDRHSLLALQAELETHRATAAKVPFLNWRENNKGEIVWANRAYLNVAEIVQSNDNIASWPPVRLFDDVAIDTAHSATDTATSNQRCALKLPNEDRKNWFEIHREPLGDDTLFTAIPVDQVVKAEATLSEFVTTLTGTFAHLPIGLAIFDHNRKLSLFNPALTDLTMLPVEFLCGQPTLFAFLDRLRDKRMAPEPKDYKTWRQEMSELEEKAVNGTYLETWFLPTGQTYRVTGRPHPGGGLALLLEDISSEMSLSHRFQAELEMGRSALDCLEDAVAVFTAGGVLSMANSAYADLWGNDPSTTLSDISISDATFAWNQKTAATPVWQQLRNFIREQGDRKKWTAPVTLKDGRVLTCRFVPMVEGATMVSFSVAQNEWAEPKLKSVRAQAIL